jgi:hypothetical protein
MLHDFISQGGTKWGPTNMLALGFGTRHADAQPAKSARCATSRHMQGRNELAYLITSSARASSVFFDGASLR